MRTLRFLNARATKVGSVPFFSQNRLPWQRSLRYQKRGPDRSSSPKKLSFGEKTAKIDPADPEKEKKEIYATKTYSPVGNLAERAKK